MEILEDRNKRSGLIAAIIYIIVMIILFITIGFKIPDPPPKEKEIEVEIEMSGGTSGSTSSKNKTNNESNQASKEVAQQKESPDQVTSSSGNQVTENTNTNNSSEQQVDESMTMNGNGNGNGGSGNGSQLGSGDGDGIGNFSGPNSGSSGRSMLVGPSNQKLDKDIRGTIYLKLVVDKEGIIQIMEYYPNKSTSQNPELIKHAKKMCSKVKFETSQQSSTEIVGPFKFRPD